MTEELLQASSAAIGGVVATVCLFPIETVKTRLQSQDPSIEPVGGANDGAIGALKNIYKEGGFAALFSGILPASIQSAIEKAVYFYSYSLLERRFKKQNETLTTTSNLIVGYLADASHLPITLPVDRIVKSLQTKKDGDFFTIGASILRNEGLFSFYSGAWTYIILCGRPAIQFTIFGQLRKLLLDSAKKTSLSSIEAFALGAIARAIATFIVYPFIRAKVLAQVASRREDGSSHTGASLHSSSPHILIPQLYRGITPELFRGVLSSAIMLMIKERIYDINKQNFMSRDENIKSRLDVATSSP